MDSGFEKSDKYFEKEYWDERYRSEESFDWFVRYESLRHLILQTIKPSDKILNLGCGNSLLPIDMYNDGFHDILNVDYSEVIIHGMKERYKDLMETSWAVMDIRDMSVLQDQSFDVIIEKGTLDSLLVGERNSWCLSEEAESMMDEVLSEISRLLKPGGRFISITFSQPHFRLPLVSINKYGWNTRTDTIGEHFHYFYYTMQKGQELSDRDRTLRDDYVKRKTLSYGIVPVSDSEDEDFLLRSDVLVDSSDCESDR